MALNNVGKDNTYRMIMAHIVSTSLHVQQNFIGHNDDKPATGLLNLISKTINFVRQLANGGVHQYKPVTCSHAHAKPHAIN